MIKRIEPFLRNEMNVARRGPMRHKGCHFLYSLSYENKHILHIGEIKGGSE